MVRWRGSVMVADGENSWFSFMQIASSFLLAILL